MNEEEKRVAEAQKQLLMETLKRTGSDDRAEASQAQYEFAQAISTPIRSAVFDGDNSGSIYMPEPFSQNQSVEYPLDIVAPGTENDYRAVVLPQIGAIPTRRVQGDYILVPTFVYGNAIRIANRFVRNASWPVVSRMLEVLEAGMVKKSNDSGWHVSCSAAVDRNIVVYDADASSGFLSKRLLSLAKVETARAGGGNMTSLMKPKLTDVFMSLEGVEDVHNWNLGDVDEITRREIYVQVNNGGYITRVAGVNLHPMHEFGEGQEYQNYIVNTLGATLPTGKAEFAIGIDMDNRDSFVMPYNFGPDTRYNPAYEPSDESSYYTRAQAGWACLDVRRVIALAF